MRTTMPIASRRAFVGLGAGVLAAALSASARGAAPPGLAAVPAPGEALETRYRTIDVGGLEITYSTSVFFVERCIIAKCHSLRKENICPS
jgi:hypothetical protein